MNFDNCVEIILKHEGEYSNNTLDIGGETKHGISKRAFPNLNIKELTVEHAKEIYRSSYWNLLCCDNLPSGIRLMVFDCAVNQGVARASIYLQKCAGVKADGVLGPITIDAVKNVSPEFIIMKFAKYRHDAYTRNPRWPHFGAGWSARLLDITIRSLMFSNALSLSQVRS